jgi:5-methylcytosine-specific restriction protein B
MESIQTIQTLDRLVQNETVSRRAGSSIRKIIAARTGMFSSSDLSNASHIGSVLRRLQELKREGSQIGTGVAIVIDEINRAEPSRVFGELLTLLEIDKREGMAEEKKVWLPYSKTLFTIPSNVSVIGTMNTVDRSLTALDFAMRRRFEFEFIAPETNLCPKDYGGVDVQLLLLTLNRRLSLLLGKGYEIGHAFLMYEKLEATCIGRQWDSELGGKLKALAYVLRSTVVPTIAEYLHDDARKIKAVVAETMGSGGLVSLLEPPLSDAVFIERLPEEYELSDSQALAYANWWNPDSAEWNASLFKDYLLSLAAGQ